MADEEQLKILRQGVAAWNEWREKNPELTPDLHEACLPGVEFSRANLSNAELGETSLSEANLSEAKLGGANLYGADLSEANLFKAEFTGANLSSANLTGAYLFKANLHEADLSGANLRGADLRRAALNGADLQEANLREAYLGDASLSRAKLQGADLSGANLFATHLRGADLSKATLHGANLAQAVLTKADLSGAKLGGAQLISTDLCDAILTGSSVYGVSVWDIKVNEGTEQQNLIITRVGEPVITVDNIKVAQFIYLLLTNKEIRDVIDTIGRKGVLLLGRFTEGRIGVLERLREELRKRDFVPMVFNFDKPEVKDFTETVRLLAGLSHFVIADITSPKSAPLELQATVPECMIPFVPILEKGEEPFAMFTDLWIKHRDWVRRPLRYSSVDRLINKLDAEIVRPAEKMFVRLLARKAKKLRVKDI